MPESDQIARQILDHIKAEGYTPQRPRQLARALGHAAESDYGSFREALRDLMDGGRVVLGQQGSVLVPAAKLGRGEFVGTYRHNRRGFGFVVPTDPETHEDLFIPPGANEGAITGDMVKAKITHQSQKGGKTIAEGKIVEILERKHTKFAGTVSKLEGQWYVFPDGNVITDPIFTPDAAGRYVTPGTKVVVEITSFNADSSKPPQGVITEILGQPGDRDVDLKSIIVQYNLPEDFPEAVKEDASAAIRDFDPEEEAKHCLDLRNEIICTIDPDDAKDYDDAISVRRLEDGLTELGVHIADVSFFVEPGSPLDEEARKRGNSTYFPGHVIPMLPEVLSNGVCSLQEGVPRLAKSAFIVLDERANPVRTYFSNSIIQSRKRLRYVEAQDLIDGKETIRHPEGDRKRSDYEPEVVKLLATMNDLARRMQKRRRAAGQLVLDLPQVDLVLDEEGKVVGARKEDDSFTHTLIEMFMVEANEAVARLFTNMNVPHMRRIHPPPDPESGERLQHFVQVAGHKIDKELDRKAIQALLEKVRGKPEQFAINLAILKSLSRAEYSPKLIGHFALASEHYSHFTSPIRRYADLTVHRLLDAYFEAVGADFSEGPVGPPPKEREVKLKGVPTEGDLEETGGHISYTERRSQDAERELRQVKVLELMGRHVGDEFRGVVTGITNFGIFVQLDTYLIEGLIRYENLMDDWWDVDAKSGVIRGERSGQTIRIGDVVRTTVVRVDVPRRELDLQVLENLTRGAGGEFKKEQKERPLAQGEPKYRTGAQKRSSRSKTRDRRKRRDP